MKMNTMVTAVVLCAMACISTSVFAEDDFGIESASPVTIADPVNPQPGTAFSAYGCDKSVRNNEEWLKSSNSKLPSKAAMKTGVDKNEMFSIDVADGVSALSVRWEGFLKCKRAATYTFLFQRAGRSTHYVNGYSVRINGQLILPAAQGEASCDANLKVGWNKIEIVCIFSKKSPLEISFKPKDSMSNPRPIAPKDLFHDQKPEEEW